MVESPEMSLDSAMRGVLALLVDKRERELKVGAGETTTTKTEVLLKRAGLSIEEIAAVTGKKYDAVRMALSRAGSD